MGEGDGEGEGEGEGGEEGEERRELIFTSGVCVKKENDKVGKGQ